MGRGGLEGRDEPGRVAGGADSVARVTTRGRRAGDGEAAYGARKEQGPVRPNTPAETEEDRGRRLGVGV